MEAQTWTLVGIMAVLLYWMSAHLPRRVDQLSERIDARFDRLDEALNDLKTHIQRHAS